MSKSNSILLLFCSFFLFSGCEKESDYYDKPDWLGAPLYEVLQNEGRFTHYLSCLERTLYAGMLKSGGYVTVMAPNDEAFEAYLSETGYPSIDAIPQEIVDKIVSYSLLQSYWRSENLSDYFQGQVNEKYIRGAGPKKQTHYFETIYEDPDYDNQWVIDQNVSAFDYVLGVKGVPDNYKYLPVFMRSYFSQSGLEASDYREFFPHTPFVAGQTSATGELGNVFDAAILKPNMTAKNGIAHEISKVQLPLDNIDKFLNESRFSRFKSLLDFKDLSGAFTYKSYSPGVNLTERFKILKPEANISTIYTKGYNNSLLVFSPALELYDNDLVQTQSNGYTLFVPSNEALTKYINERLLKYYPSLEEMPLEAITTLINTHMAETMIWPSQMQGAHAATGEYINGEGATGADYFSMGILDKQFASNGFIYSIDHVLKSKLFETVYSEIFLNPAYSMLNAGYIKYYENTMRVDLMKSALSGYPNERFTLLLFPDALLEEDGFSYAPLSQTFTNTFVINTTAEERLKKLIRLHLFDGWVDNNHDAELDFSQGGIAEYGGWGFRTSNGGDVIRYKGNRLQATGNIEEQSMVNISQVETFDNGTAYSVDGLLQFSKRTTNASDAFGWNYNRLWYYLEQTAAENPNVSEFVAYVKAALKGTDTDGLSGISEENFYTIIMPDNNAMAAAVANGDLPALSNVVIENPDAMDRAANFLRSHFLQGTAFPDDRLPYFIPYNVNAPDSRIVSTMYRINDEELMLINQRTNVRIVKEAGGTLRFLPENVLVDLAVVAEGSMGMDSPAHVVAGAAPNGGNNGYRSNRIAGRAIHHEYTNYFKFTIRK